MYRIGILSDSHGDFASVERALALMGDVQAIIHAGDYLRDSQRLARSIDVPVIGVAGNCDSWPHPREEVFELEGQRFFVTHGHVENVKSDTSGIIEAARRNHVDIAIYGHTHVPAMFVQRGILFINPGSTSHGRRGKAPSCAVLTIEGLEVSAAFITIEKMPK